MGIEDASSLWDDWMTKPPEPMVFVEVKGDTARSDTIKRDATFLACSGADFLVLPCRRICVSATMTTRTLPSGQAPSKLTEAQKSCWRRSVFRLNSKAWSCCAVIINCPWHQNMDPFNRHTENRMINDI